MRKSDDKASNSATTATTATTATSRATASANASATASATATAGAVIPSARHLWLPENKTNEKKEARTKQTSPPRTGESPSTVAAAAADRAVGEVSLHSDQIPRGVERSTRDDVGNLRNIREALVAATTAADSLACPDVGLGQKHQDEIRKESCDQEVVVEGDTTAAYSLFDASQEEKQEQVQRPGAYPVYPSGFISNNNNHNVELAAMVEADLVEPPSEKMLVQAEPLVEPKPPIRLSIMLFVLAGAVIIVALVVGLSVGLTSNNNKSITPTTTTTTGAPTTLNATAAPGTLNTTTEGPIVDWKEAFRSSLPENTKASIEEEAADPTLSSPQYRAFVWATETDQVPLLEPQDKRIRRMTQRFALATLYYATNGESWGGSRNWLDPSLQEGEWYGCSTKGDLNDLKDLDLYSNMLMGSIPPELGMLSYLTSLFLPDNQLTGTLPAQLGDFTNLGYLDLHGCELTGSIPAVLGNLSKLAFLYLGKNRLNGTIPSQLGDATNLEDLWLYDNELTGSIPTELGRLQGLNYLSLKNNRLNGPLPTELSRLPRLEKLRLYNNALTGTIPSELGSLEILKELYLHENQLKGSMPEEICDLMAANAIPEDDDSGKPLVVSVDCDLIQCECSSSNCTCGTALDDNDDH